MNYDDRGRRQSELVRKAFLSSSEENIRLIEIASLEQLLIAAARRKPRDTDSDSRLMDYYYPLNT